MSFLLVMKAEIVRTFIIMRRYWLRTLVGMVMGYGMLMVLILGYIYSQSDVTDALKDRLGDPEKSTAFVLSFIIGMFAFGIVGMFTQGIQGMAVSGVLEQLCLSPHGLVTNFMARSTVAAANSVVSSSIMVWMVAATVGGELHVDALALPVLFVLTFINLLGFGFMMGGLILVFKQVGQVAILIRMGLFGLAIFAKEELLNQGWAMATLVHILPIADASILLKHVLIHDQMLGDQYLSVFRHQSMGFLVLSCIVWTAVGIGCFKFMENWSRAKGTLGTY
jgi:ABC-type polysaccharide/polyol phosphate export permease